MKTSVFILMFALFMVQCKNIQKPAKDTPDSFFTLFIGTYTEKEANIEGKSGGIYIYRMNAETGELSYVNTSPFTMNPSYVDISTDGRYLFAVNETGGDTADGYISSFRITGDFENLEFINRVSSGGDYPCYIDAGEGFVMAANYGSGNVVRIKAEQNGTLNEPAFISNHEGKGKTSRQESAHAHCIILSPDGAFAYSNDLGTDKIYIYALKDNETVLSGVYQSQPGAGPRHLTFHPRLPLVYSINELNGTIECLERDTATGALIHKQTVSTVGDLNGSEAGSADIHITPDGQFLYATNRGKFNNIASYRIDPAQGTLSLIGIQSVKGQTPRNFAIDPAGKFLLVANQNSDQIVTFRIDQVSGRLADTGIETSVPVPVCIKFLPAHLNN